MIFLGMTDTSEYEEKGCAKDSCMPECTSPWEENNGTCYFWSQDKLFWGAAEERCRELGGHLASVTTEKEHNYLRLKVGEIKTI